MADAAGNVYDTDGVNACVQVFDGEGRFPAAWGTPGNGNGEFALPTGIAPDGQGHVYVTDVAGRVQTFRLLPPLASATHVFEAPSFPIAPAGCHSRERTSCTSGNAPPGDRECLDRSVIPSSHGFTREGNG